MLLNSRKLTASMLCVDDFKPCDSTATEHSIDLSRNAASRARDARTMGCHWQHQVRL